MYYRDENGDWQEIILEPSGDTLPVGAITQFGGENAPTNWLFCNGQSVSRTDYAELFETIGTTYGDGDGSTTFNLPDFSSRSPMGVGEGTDGTNTETTTLGQEKGEYKHQLTVDEMPEHNHKLGTNINCTAFGTNNSLARGTNGSFEDKDAQNYIKNTGGNQAHNTVHPILGVNFIIKAKQSIGIVGTVSEDITDTNENAVPTCETVKNYVDTHINIPTDGTVVKAGYQVNGKDIYVKRVTINSLPNNNELNYDTGLSNSTTTPVKIEGLYDGSFPINFIYPPAVQYSIATYIRRVTSGYTTWTIDITTGTDRSSMEGYVDVYFYYN